MMQDNCPAWNGVAPTGPILRPDAAAEYLGISTAAYYIAANGGTLPKPIKIGARATGVPRPWLDAVIGRAAALGAVR